MVVGDSYTETGLATGGGHDKLHGWYGNDTLYGDDYAASDKGATDGGAVDTVNAGNGDDRLFGGPERDVCGGSVGRDGGGPDCEVRVELEYLADLP